MAFEIKKNVLKQYIPELGQTEVIIPEGIDTIGTKAFGNCGELNSVILPEGITVLKQYALDSYECKIKRLRVPATLKETGKNSFPAELKTVELPNGMAQFASEHDSFEVTEIISYLLDITEKCFSELRTGSRLELALIALAEPALMRENVRAEILQYAKAQKKKLIDRILMNGLTAALGGALAAGLISAKAVEDHIAKAGGNAEMTAMLLNYKDQQLSPADKERIEKQRTESVFKPLSVTDTKKNWSFDKNEDGTGYILTSYKGTETAIEIPAMIGKLPVVEIRGICNCGFNSKVPYARQGWLRENVISVQIPEGIAAIGDYAFSALGQLKTVSIPTSVMRIGNGAFSDCPCLTEVCVPEHMTVLDYRAFGGCTGLRKVILPVSVTEINKWAFEKCPNLTIHASAGSYAETYAKENNIPFTAE